jgi:hypothetical protein
MTSTSAPFQPGDVVVVRSGRLAGVVGSVCAVSTGTGRVGLKIPATRRTHWLEPHKLDRVDADAS